MEVHRISENTIRVTMDADELKERGITMLDLLGNKSQIQHFFYQILSEVDSRIILFLLKRSVLSSYAK